MKALVIAAHGSRKKESVLEVAALTKKIAEKAAPEFDCVVYGFLQFAEPRLTDVVADIVGQGALEVMVFPFFISSGSHILTDIPELVAACRQTYPDVSFTVTRHLGAAPSMADIILGEVRRETC